MKKNAKKPDNEKGGFYTGSVNTSEKTPKKGGGFTLGSDAPTINPLHVPFEISGHKLLWKYHLSGTPQRGDFKPIKMRGWEKRVWHKFMGCSIVANKNTLEIFTHRPKTKNIKRLLSFAWLKVDNARREFSRWQQVGLTEIESPHPLALHLAHLVFEDKKINRLIVPAIKAGIVKQDLDGVGLGTDESHKGKGEMEGRLSAEGMEGAEFVFIQLPQAWKEREQTDAEKWQNLDAGMGLLRAENAKLAEALALIIKNLHERR